MKTKWFWIWIGGAISHTAASGLVTGIFILIYGVTPGEAIANLLGSIPPWLTNPWFKLALVIIGLFVIGASLHFNVWSLRQRAVDDLAEDLSWAIHNLLNKPVFNNDELTQWESDYRGWCDKVSKKLENRAFFNKADQLHFDRLGFVPLTKLTDSFGDRHDWLLSQLDLKFQRLRDVINWTQMRKH